MITITKQLLKKLIESMEDQELSIEAKAIFTYLTFTSEDGETFVPLPEITKDLNISKDRFYNHINILLEQGYIKRKRTRDEEGHFTLTKYILSGDDYNGDN